ncbi:MAG TPA: M1 family metallopeptidase [Terriglobia bacterium]|nr:M1 family metallopeptidase [Terriglobia bacterium]
MRKRAFITKALICLLVAATQPNAGCDTYPRQSNLHVDHYTFRVALSDSNNEIVGQTTVDLHFLTADTTEFELDLIQKRPDGKGMSVSSVASGGQRLRYEQLHNRLRIFLASPSKVSQAAEYSIAYHGIPAGGLLIGPNRYRDRSFDTNDWPDKARNWLPCIDHPSDKATDEMIVTAPAHYQVISNGRLVEQVDLPGHMRRTLWKESVPIASWLYSLAAAPYAVQYLRDIDGVPIETWVYPQERKIGFNAFARFTIPIFDFYSSHIGPFSYEKLANVEANGTFGGMELASDIFYGYRPNVITTIQGQQLIAHEIAHQWFGDSVTEDDWDDVWLSEGFATYFALVYLKHADGHTAFLRGLDQSRSFILKFSAKHPDYTIVHNNISDLRTLLTNQIYQKGAWTLHMLHDMLGDAVFWAGIREYYKQYRNRNATTGDFERIMESASHENLSWFFHEWLNEGAVLKIKGRWWYDARAKQLEVELDQKQKGTLFRMPIPVGIYFAGSQSSPQIQPLEVKTWRNRFGISLDHKPAAVVLDPNMSVLMQAKFAEARN